MNPDLLEPGASRQPQVRPAIRCEVEGRDLTRDLDGVHREGIQACGTQSNAAGAERRSQQWDNRRLVHQIRKHGKDIEVVLLSLPGERRVRFRSLVALEPEADLEAPGHVTSSVRRVRSRIRSIRIRTRSSGSGQATRLSCSSQSSAASRRCTAGSSGRIAASA